MSDFSRYYNAVKYLEGLVNIQSGPNYMSGKTHDPSIYIKRMQWFLDLLGNPERGFKYIHITGTAGKGTVASTIHYSLHTSGHKTGLFTSPFVTTSIEKIQVGDLYIDPLEFAQIVEDLKPKIDEAFAKCPWGGPSYFERFLAIALIYFKKMQCEYVVLEVGCGGRYDATNVIPAPEISAITNIDYDHMHILGKTLTKIAGDKAGIIKRGSKFFTTEARPRLRKIMEDICKEQGPEFNYIKGGNKELVEAMGFRAEEVKLPARFEIVQEKPIVIIDGAHNRAKFRYTAEKLKQLTFDKLHLVVALAANKEREIIEEIPADVVYPTRFQNAERKCMNLGGYTDSGQALDAALAAARSNDLVLVTGSFYLAGELRTRWYPEEDILVHRSAFPHL
ncbi:MAG: hypothetical protein AAB420_03295 [Patescibacteria group bacterium]